ncbi:MAG: CPBP family intramembrane metalloprotease [Acidimicrobiia bacterium]|nr:CPBP family intramembrane metalloprotease [Acidimicrobiia bacterium]
MTSRVAGSPSTSGPLAHEGEILAIAVVANVAANRLVSRRHYIPANVTAGTATVTLARGDGLSWSELGLDPADVVRGLRFGLPAAGLVVLVVTAGAVHPQIRRFFVDERVVGADRREILLESLLRIPIATALFEEVLFRGVLLGAARRRLPMPAAVAASSFLFGLWHVLPTLDTVEGNPAGGFFGSKATAALAAVVGTAVAGAGFAWLRIRSRSVVAPTVVHIATNTAAYLAAAVVIRRAGRPGSSSGLG